MKNRVVLLLVFMIFGCSSNEAHLLVSSYSKKEDYSNENHVEDEWFDVWPLLSINDDFLIKIHPSSWRDLARGSDYCNSRFYFMFWADLDIAFDMNKTHFIDVDGNVLKIKLVTRVGDGSVEFDINDDSSGGLVHILTTSFSSAYLYESWSMRNMDPLYGLSKRNSFELVADGKVGCAKDTFSLELVYTIKEEERIAKIMFFPFEYKRVTY